MQGMDELFVWLDAVAARTTHGPVVLVCSHGDHVLDPATRQRVSQAITQRLADQEHPLLARIERPATGDLLFHVLDNTRGLRDPGVLQYRNALQALCRDAPSATMRVPLALLTMYDSIVQLQ